MKMGRILVIDDEVGFLNVLKKYLTMRGYEVFICDNAESSYLCAKENAFDIVIIDIRMPMTNGITAIKEIEKFDNSASFIIMTGFSINDENVAILKQNIRVREILQKPFDFNKLVSRIDDIIKSAEEVI